MDINFVRFLSAGYPVFMWGHGDSWKDNNNLNIKEPKIKFIIYRRNEMPAWASLIFVSNLYTIIVYQLRFLTLFLEGYIHRVALYMILFIYSYIRYLFFSEELKLAIFETNYIIDKRVGAEWVRPYACRRNMEGSHIASSTGGPGFLACKASLTYSRPLMEEF